MDFAARGATPELHCTLAARGGRIDIELRNRGPDQACRIRVHDPVPAAKKLVRSALVTEVEAGSSSPGKRVRHQRDLAVGGDAVGKFDRGEEHQQHQRGGDCQFDRRDSPRQSAMKAAVDRFARNQINDFRFIFIAPLTNKGRRRRKGLVLERRGSARNRLPPARLAMLKPSR